MPEFAGDHGVLLFDGAPCVFAGLIVGRIQDACEVRNGYARCAMGRLGAALR